MIQTLLTNSFLRQLPTSDEISLRVSKEFFTMDSNQRKELLPVKVEPLPETMDFPEFKIIGKRPYHCKTYWLLIPKSGLPVWVQHKPTAGLHRTNNGSEWYKADELKMPSRIVRAYRVQVGVIASRCKPSYGIRVQQYDDRNDSGKFPVKASDILNFIRGQK